MSVLPLYNALLRAGVPEDDARTAAESVAGIEQVPSKADLEALRTDMARMEARLDARMARQELHIVGWLIAVVSIATTIIIAVLG